MSQTGYRQRFIFLRDHFANSCRPVEIERQRYRSLRQSVEAADNRVKVYYIHSDLGRKSEVMGAACVVYLQTYSAPGPCSGASSIILLSPFIALMYSLYSSRRSPTGVTDTSSRRPDDKQYIIAAAPPTTRAGLDRRDGTSPSGLQCSKKC